MSAYTSESPETLTDTVQRACVVYEESCLNCLCNMPDVPFRRAKTERGAAGAPGVARPTRRVGRRLPDTTHDTPTAAVGGATVATPRRLTVRRYAR